MVSYLTVLLYPLKFENIGDFFDFWGSSVPFFHVSVWGSECIFWVLYDYGTISLRAQQFGCLWSVSGERDGVNVSKKA